MGLAGVTEAQGETGTALLRSASLAHSRSRGERSDMGSENKKSVSWVPPLRAGLAKFILGRNVKRTEEPKRTWFPSSTCLPRGNKHAQIIISPPTRPRRRLGRDEFSSWEGGSFRPGGEGRPRLQTWERPRRPDFCTPCGCSCGGKSHNLAPPCGRDRLPAHQARGYLLSWHPAGPGFPAPSPLPGPPGPVLVNRQVKGSEGCYHWAGVCESRVPSSSFPASWPGA